MKRAIRKRYGRAGAPTITLRRAPGRDRWWVKFEGQDVGIVAKRTSPSLPAGVREWAIEEVWAGLPRGLALAKLNEAISELRARDT